MPSITHILVPTDFSEASDAALAYARMLAAQFGASVTVAHVYDDVFANAAFAPEVYGSVPPGLGEEALRDLRQRLANLLTEHEIERGRIEVLYGPTSRAIVDQAAAHGTDLIVMGTHGRRGLSHAVLGSVAGQVLRTAPCPVLTVRRHPARTA